MNTGKWQSPTVLLAFAFFVAWMARQGRLSAMFQALSGNLSLAGGTQSVDQYPQDTGSLGKSNVSKVKKTAASQPSSTATGPTSNIPVRQVPDRQAANPTG
jgi:hypothetical protein